jgi:hypothetical protein
VQIAHSHIENGYISLYNMPLDTSFIPSHVDTNEMGYTKVILKFNNESNQLQIKLVSTIKSWYELHRIL